MEFDKEKVKLKIAISNMKEEAGVAMVNKNRNILKTIITTIMSIAIGTGVVFAGTIVYENIWKEPEKIELSTNDFEELSKITEESKKENISEEEAKQIAIKKLEQIGFNANIVGTNHYKDIDSNKISYRFKTEDNYEITINGKTGEFYDIWNNNPNRQDTTKLMTRQEAIEIANKYYELFGFKPGEYEMSYIWTNNEDDSCGFKIDIKYNKKYGETYNPYESIWLAIESKNKDLDYFRVEQLPFDNNEEVITKEQAIEIALKEDEKVKTNKVESTKAKLMIVKMNADSYDRSSDIDKHYEAMQTVDYPQEERNYYKVEDRVRKAWVVVINYEDNYNGDIAKRYTEGQYSYFIDATTGEVIGGHSMDYIYSEEVNYNVD